MTDDDRRVAKPKLRIRSEEGNKTSRVTGVDDGENTLPPRAIGPKDMLGYNSNVHRMIGTIRFMCTFAVEIVLLHSIRDAMTAY